MHQNPDKSTDKAKTAEKKNNSSSTIQCVTGSFKSNFRRMYIRYYIV